MVENIEFIQASELPIAESEEVDVICVENGEMKRKAGANLGGGTKEDLRIVVQNFDPYSLEITSDNISIISGSIVDLCNKIRLDEKPIVKIIHVNSSDYHNISSEYTTNPIIYGEWVYISHIVYNTVGVPYWCRICYLLDGSIDGVICVRMVEDY